jgi:amino acid transporter
MDSPSTPSRDEFMVADTDLRGGAIGLPGAMMQAITDIAPALGLWFVVQFLGGVAGITSPLVLGIGWVILLLEATSLVQLAKHLPSAGGYFTYLSRTIHPRVGFMAGWLYFIYQPMCPPINPVFLGLILEDTFKQQHWFDFPWWAFFLIAVAFLAFVSYRGIKFSAEWLIGLGVSEIAIVLALGIWGLADPGRGGFSFAPFNPASAPSVHGIYLGVIGSLLVLVGFESAAPIAEETRNPKRNIPIAILGSVIILGILQMISSWGLTIGWGTKDIHSFVTSVEIPPFVLARRYWGGAWVLALLALVNSCLALSVACTNASTRVAYSMAKSGALPPFFAKVHPKYKTPVNAITVQMLIMVAVGLGVGFWIGPDEEYFTIALAFTLALVLIYTLGNIGVIRFFRTEMRREFNWFLHLFCPVVATAAVLFVGYKSVIPLPPEPIKYAPVVLGVWIVLGVAVLIYLRWRGRETWMISAVKEATEHVEDLGPQVSDIAKEIGPPPS